MNDTSKIFLNKVADDIVIDILKSLIPALSSARIEYFIVGAFARDIDLLVAGHPYPPSRKTKDLDLAVMMASEKDFEKMRAMIANLENFATDPKEPYRFIFKQNYEVDFIPFGDIANESGEVILQEHQAFVLNIPGFEEVASTVSSISTHEVGSLKTVSLAGVVFLKLLAWQDRPERTKDIQDIQYILKYFMFLNIEKISNEPDNILAIYSEENRLFDEMVAARYIGREINRMLVNSPKLRKRILELLDIESSDAAKSRMGRLMNNDNIEESVRLIRQLYLGVMD